MQGADDGSGLVARRVRRFAVIGAAIGVVLYVVKLGSDDFDVGGDWPWLILIVLGAAAGAALGLVAAGIGQSEGAD